jgi:pimeloyl-ACP methyl ester carboxylesterase
VPEIKALSNIDVAFMPMNLPFTMAPAEAAECVKAFKPKIAIPYHFQGQNPKQFETAVAGSGIEVRMLDWYPVVEVADVVKIDRPGALVDVGGRKMHVNCTGRGQPTVILEGSDDTPSLDWWFVQPDLAKTTRVCSSDHAGMGWSEPAKDPLTVDRVVADLHAALTAAGEAPPYVIVGASIGALQARAFQLKYPTEVAGIVFENAGHEDQFRVMVDGKITPAWQATAGQFRKAMEEMRPPADAPPPPPPPPSREGPFAKLPPDVLATRMTFERRFFNRSSAEGFDRMMQLYDGQRVAFVALHEASTGNQHPLGSRPVLVLVSEEGRDAESKTIEAKLAALSTNSAQRVVPGAGPDIHLVDPASVVRAVQDVVTAARSNSPLH